VRSRRLTLDAAGTWLFIAIVLAIALSVALSFAMNAAAEELRQEVRIVSSLPRESPRTAWGVWFAERMSADLAPSDPNAELVRAADLDHRADRIRELAGAGALAGLLLMLATARPEARLTRSQSATSPAASTRSNGTV